VESSSLENSAKCLCCATELILITLVDNHSNVWTLALAGVQVWVGHQSA